MHQLCLVRNWPFGIWVKSNTLTQAAVHSCFYNSFTNTVLIHQYCTYSPILYLFTNTVLIHKYCTYSQILYLFTNTVLIHQTDNQSCPQKLTQTCLQRSLSQQREHRWQYLATVHGLLHSRTHTHPHTHTHKHTLAYNWFFKMLWCDTDQQSIELW